MTSRERVRLILEHKEADKVPIDFGAMRSTGIAASAYNKLKDYLGMNNGPSKLYDVFQQLAEPDPELLERFQGDIIQLHRLEPSFGINILEYKEDTLPDGSPILTPKDFNPVVKEDGSRELYVDGKLIAVMPSTGLYYELVHHPYEHCQTKEDIDAVAQKQITDFELEYLNKNARDLYENTDKAILASFGGNIIEAGQSDFGFENFLLLMALDPELVHHYFNRLTNKYMYDLERYMEAVGDYIDVVQFGDDLGMQDSPLISVEMYREMVKPYHKRMFQFVQKNYPHVKVFFHSCGSIYDLIPDLIDAGVQVLNPVQLSAKKMDPVNLKENFGKDIVFWGGGIDTQQTLTNCKLEEIEPEVKKLINIFAKDGGFVFTQSHNIQANISPEKITTLYDSAIKHRDYKNIG